jgi:hypothetical protein
MSKFQTHRTQPPVEVIPPEYFTIIESAHNDILGHCGIDATLRKLKLAKQYWHRMREHVARFIHSCPICQKFWSIPPTPVLPDRTIEVYEPFHTISSDILGPFPADSNGNVYIHSVVDAASRHVNYFAHPSITAKTLALDLLRLFSQYAICAEIRSDNGPQYISDLIAEFLALLDIQHVKIVPYRHESGNVSDLTRKATAISTLYYSPVNAVQTKSLGPPLLSFSLRV